jgi:hypothetical protein|mmetsp:Transcript_1783/g.3323  ORF Transcript_1783/g.3323 Transcript_1783/m.3323 type:complete len:99 (+) Transcript_1783:3750-4046(+)
MFSLFFWTSTANHFIECKFFFCCFVVLHRGAFDRLKCGLQIFLDILWTSNGKNFPTQAEEAYMFWAIYVGMVKHVLRVQGQATFAYVIVWCNFVPLFL